MQLAPGLLVDDRYKILSLLADGGFGSVYRASQLGLDRIVALKLLDNTEPASSQRFEQEANILTSLKHRNIVLFYGYGVYSGKPYLVTELVEGATLKEYLAKEGPLDAATAVSFAKQLCNALGCAHAHGVVHRDLKPSNILCVEDASNEGGIPTIKVIDFGLAKLLPEARTQEQSITAEGHTVGSLHYMSPEQCSAGVIDARTDIYALGCVLFECIAGHPPFNGHSPAQIMQKHLRDPVPSLPDTLDPDIRSQLQAIVRTATAKEQEQRYQSAESFLHDLERVSVAEHNVPSLSKQTPFGTLKPIMVLTVLVGLSIAVYFGISGKRTDTANSVSNTKLAWVFPSRKIEYLCESQQTTLLQLKDELAEPHSIIDRTTLELAYARRLPRAESVIFLEKCLEKVTDCNESVRLYSHLALYGRSAGRSITYSQQMLQRGASKANSCPMNVLTALELAEAYIQLRHDRDGLNVLSAFDEIPTDTSRQDEITFTVMYARIRAAASVGDAAVIKQEGERLEKLLCKYPWLAERLRPSFGAIINALRRHHYSTIADQLSSQMKATGKERFAESLIAAPPPINSSIYPLWVSAIAPLCTDGSMYQNEANCRAFLKCKQISEDPEAHQMLLGMLAGSLEHQGRMEEAGNMEEQLAAESLLRSPPSLAYAITHYFSASRCFQEVGNTPRSEALTNKAMMLYDKAANLRIDAPLYAEIVCGLIHAGKKQQAEQALHILTLRCQSTQSPVLANIAPLDNARPKADRTTSQGLYKCMAIELAKANENSPDQLTLMYNWQCGIETGYQLGHKDQAQVWSQKAVRFYESNPALRINLPPRYRRLILRILRYDLVLAAEDRNLRRVQADTRHACDLFNFIDDADLFDVDELSNWRHELLKCKLLIEADFINSKLKKILATQTKLSPKYACRLRIDQGLYARDRKRWAESASELSTGLAMASKIKDIGASDVQEWQAAYKDVREHL